MSADESFLGRWSRRKSAAAAKRDRRVVAPPEGNTEGPAIAAEAPAVQPAPVIDPASLPPIESIDAGSDIRAFLAPGVPANLAQAALRRAWSADPAIRDFVGLSENSWNFTAPGGVPGFGSITAEEVQRLLTQFTSEPSGDVAGPADGSAGNEASRGEGASGHQEADLEPTPPDPSDLPTRQEREKHEITPTVKQRRHGGALPE